MAANNPDLKIIGRLEHVDFPQWKFYDIDAKIDTGAYTSSLHCHHIVPIEKEGEPHVRFNLLDPSHETYNDKLFELPVYRKKTIKSSNGSTENRFVIKTDITIGGQTFEAQFSLTDRSEMRYPVLIGRKLLNNNFLVDVSKKFITRKEIQETKN